MAGLYEGLEEAPFKPVDGGYVFQANNPWLIGPRRRYFVDDAQKAAIAGCIRQTLQRIKPWVFVAAVLIPAITIILTFWFAMRGATLSVTVTEAGGPTTTYTQPIGRNGSTGTLAGAAGAKVAFAVSGPPARAGPSPSRRSILLERRTIRSS